MYKPMHIPLVHLLAIKSNIDQSSWIFKIQTFEFFLRYKEIRNTAYGAHLNPI